MLLIAALCALGLAACGGGANGPAAFDSGSLTGDTSQDQKAAYDTSMERMRSTLEDASAPPIDQSIAKGNRKQLLSMATRWDEAIQVVAAADPPQEISAQHTKLLRAMRQLGIWNHRIAEAAPNAKRTKSLGTAAQKSQAAKDFGSAVASIESAGYSVLNVQDAEDPFNDAPAP
jgi:hypothetical protein